MKIKAYAKINLILDVLNKREDGYHNVDFLMTSLNLYDEIEVKKSEEDIVKVLNNKNIKQENNLSYKALKLIKNKYNIQNNYEINIVKNIPIAAGLAGGSTDAAATLKLINELEQLNLSIKELEKLAIEIGSDVPFCLHSRYARVRQKGDDVEILDELKSKYNVLLINNGKELSTKEVYSIYKQNRKAKIPIENILKLEGEEFYKCLRNDLEEFAISLEPSIKEIMDDVKKNSNISKVMVSGSGPSVIVMDKSLEKLKTIKNKISSKYKHVEIYKML